MCIHSAPASMFGTVMDHVAPLAERCQLVERARPSNKPQIRFEGSETWLVIVRRVMQRSGKRIVPRIPVDQVHWNSLPKSVDRA
jgi:hypothetical protein